MKTISILGSGWLGLPLARHLITAGHPVKASTRSEAKLADLESIGASPFIVDIDELAKDLQPFLQADILIINITSKNVAGFRRLVDEIAYSRIEKVLFVSSTSVYEACNATITEADTDCFSQSPLLDIENLFRQSLEFKTTIIRFGGLFGYSRQPGRFFRSGKLVRDPEAPVNLIHRDDCIGMISRVIELDTWGEVFNGCADTHPSKRAFYTRAAESIDHALPEFAETVSMPFKIISNQKVKQVLNYQFMHPDLMEIEFDKDT